MRAILGDVRALTGWDRWTCATAGWLLAMGCGGRVVLDAEGAGDAASGGRTADTGGGGGLAGSAGTGGTGATGGSSCGNVKTNPDHCGACGHSCLGGECAAGACQPVVLQYFGNEGATALALDATDVFWASPVQRARKNGEGLITLADAGSGVWGVAVDETSVYWTDIDHGAKRINKDGTGDVIPLGRAGYRIAVDATDVYTAWQGVWKISKEDASVTELATFGGEGIALDEQFVYVTTWSPGGVFKLSKLGAEITALAAAEYSAYVAAHDRWVYFTTQGSDSGVYAVEKDAAGGKKLLAKAVTPYGIAADDRGVYWTDFDAGSIWMLPSGSDAPVELASGQHNPRDLAVDEQAVYWTNDAIYSAVSRVAKPSL